MTFSVITEFAAGLSFFLYGMNVLSEGLKKMSGGKAERILKKVTKNPLMSVLLGVGVTVAVQSSSAVTVMLVGLVNSGLMSLACATAVIIGANMGTTVTAWITAFSVSGSVGNNLFLSFFKPENLSPVFSVIGIAFIILSENEKKKNTGTVFVAFTVLFYGMKLMAGSVSGLENSRLLFEAFKSFENPLSGLIIGACVTALIQSSSASVSVLQAFTLSGGITYNMAIPVVLGQNIGTCATAVISSAGTNIKAKRVAAVNVIINTLGAVIFLTTVNIAVTISGTGFLKQVVDPVGIAGVHTVFNILNAFVMYPVKDKIIKLAEVLVKEKSVKGEFTKG